MTSRVIDGRREQEAIQSFNWNSMMAKSDRSQGNGVTYSHGSLVQTNQPSMPPRTSIGGVTKSANFGKVTMGNNAFAMNDFPDSIHATRGNFPEEEVFSLDGLKKDLRGTINNNWSDTNSFKGHQQDNTENSYPNNMQAFLELPSND